MLHKPFGGNPSKQQRHAYEKLENYQNGKFVNLAAIDSSMRFSDILSMIKKSIFSGNEERRPAQAPPLADIDWDRIASERDSLTWFGHSAFLLSMDNKKILIDPMLGNRASPVSFAGGTRYNKNMLDIIQDLPPLDAVFLTHDHYDHLDFASISRLKNKVGHFLVPLGVSAHLIRWGIEREKITELNWWDEIDFKGLTVALTPSHHFSGRGAFNGNSTLWGGWVILGKSTRFYISGDGGYGDHFKQIGEKYGPFDISLLEGGQYDDLWKWAHMTPEESVQAHLDVKGKTMLLTHWGAFTLAFHSWKDPIERAVLAAEQLGVHLTAPKIGETLLLNDIQPQSPVAWWNR
ncbi:MBL fold metallo-hydrolase [Saccharibacillus kuerlensis]|uniref:Membrane protein n=1 Tax=Saccharibacillus kuerlensis TaxID=459527 RepID=A0ABQ2L3Y1_9BACL|nr:MBL fold metallo-hydrolase [Saccharibacillus kuerlensis]GGO01890.1 membrane protein [Saccharibacillus kuerlensis]